MAEQIILEILKVGGPVALLIILGYVERKSMLDRHGAQLEKFIEVSQKNIETMKELVTLVREKLE